MLKVRVFDVDFRKAEVVINEHDAKDLGFTVHDRAKIIGDKGSTIGVINTTKTFVGRGELGVFDDVKRELKLKGGEKIKLEPVEKPVTVSYIKKKLDGVKLSKDEIYKIVEDIVNKNLTLIDLSAFVSALHVRGMDMDEVEWLTKAMTESGEILDFKKETFDKHSLGGVPGDKTTLLVVPIVASAGLTIPKTSSRAITDPAGTADRMELFAPVEHGLKDIERIVRKCGGCVVWGGAVDLAPADDALIQVEHPLSLDPRPLLLASVMSKKHAVNSKHIVIDIPMGPETKIHNEEEARKIALDFIELGRRLGMSVECAVTYGSQPVGDAMGPALEAKEALETLQGKGPGSLVEKGTAIAGILLEAGGIVSEGKGQDKAKEILKSGQAYEKFKQIIKAQGGNPDIKVKDIKPGKLTYVMKAEDDGYVTRISNLHIKTAAKLAGAPNNKGAGILLHAKGGEAVKRGQPLFTIYAEEKYKLKYAEDYAKEHKPVSVEGMLLEEIPGTMISRH